MIAKPFIGTYRSKSGRFFFKWAFSKRPNGEIRTYIVEAPGYDSVNIVSCAESGLTHIDREPMPLNLKDAVQYAKDWAEDVDSYILRTSEFPIS